MKPALRWVGPALCLLPLPVLAHTPIDGIDDLYAGLLHPVLVPAHLLGVLMLGILFGQQGVQRVEVAIIAFLIALPVGLALTLLDVVAAVEVPLLLTVATIGGLVAAAFTLPVALLLVLAAAMGGMLGLDSAQPQLADSGRLAALIGTAIAASLLMLYGMAFADWFSKRPWQRIGVRVAGSWAAASAILVLALSLVH